MRKDNANEQTPLGEIETEKPSVTKGEDATKGEEPAEKPDDEKMDESWVYN